MVCTFQSVIQSRRGRRAGRWVFQEHYNNTPTRVYLQGYQRPGGKTRQRDQSMGLAVAIRRTVAIRNRVRQMSPINMFHLLLHPSAGKHLRGEEVSSPIVYLVPGPDDGGRETQRKLKMRTL